MGINLKRKLVVVFILILEYLKCVNLRKINEMKVSENRHTLKRIIENA